MTLKLYAHPLSSYSQKVLTALYENRTRFEYRQIDYGSPQVMAELTELWPFRKFPVLVDVEAGRTVVEASVIVEYLGLYPSGAVPAAAGRSARRARGAQHGPFLRQLCFDAAAKSGGR